MESIFQERPPPPPWPSYSGPLRWTLSLSLVKQGFSLGNLRKSSEPITAVRQATRENSGASQGLILDFQCYVGRTRLQCTEAFFLPLNSRFLPSLNFQDLTHLGGGSKTAGGKKSFSSGYKAALAGALPCITQRLEKQLPDPP
jgi:hypothetical protein